MDPSGTNADCQLSRRSGECQFSHECNLRQPSQRSKDEIELRLQQKYQHGWRRILLNFTPSWFSVTMGTGISSILLHNLPYNADWVRKISIVIFVLNVVLFVGFSAITILRHILFRGSFSVMIQDPVQSLFVGTIPMSLATIVNMIVYVGVPAWGSWAATFAWALWWVDVAIALTTCVSLPFIVMHVHENELSRMTAVSLLPVVATIVAASTGGIVADVLEDSHHALWTIITSYILWGTGFPLAMVILVMYFHRLTIHRLPPREVIVSVFLPLGPLGTGSFALVQLGKVAMRIFPLTNTLVESSGQTFYTLGVGLALVIWGYGLVWLFFALASITRTTFPFNMGWWGFTFPLGVFAVSTTTLADELPSHFFRVLGTMLSLTVVFLWLGISLATLHGTIKGTLFFASCVQSYQKDLIQKQTEKELAQQDLSVEA